MTVSTASPYQCSVSPAEFFLGVRGKVEVWACLAANWSSMFASLASVSLLDFIALYPSDLLPIGARAGRRGVRVEREIRRHVANH